MNDTTTMLSFQPADFDELLPMWRESFEAGVGIKDPHTLAEQANYFWAEVVPKNQIQVARRERRLLAG